MQLKFKNYNEKDYLTHAGPDRMDASSEGVRVSDGRGRSASGANLHAGQRFDGLSDAEQGETGDSDIYCRACGQSE